MKYVNLKKSMKCKFILIFITLFLISSCVTIDKSMWKHESGYRVGDFIDFKSNVYVLKEGYIYQNDKKVASVVEMRFGFVGNHKLIIQATTTKEIGVYTAN